MKVVVFSVIISFWLALVCLAGLMFQYSLFTFTGKDVPFLLDIFGGIVTNAINFLVFVFCMIYRACGYPIPIIS